MDTKICPNCGGTFCRTDKNQGKRFCKDVCKKTYHYQKHRSKNGNELWEALDRGPIGPELEPAYEAARLAAREWNLKRLAALAAV